MTLWGPGGIGKTTLMRLLVGELQPQRGTINWGGTCKAGYFPQDSSHLFKTDANILEWIGQFTESQDINAMRAMLGRMRATWSM